MRLPLTPAHTRLLGRVAAFTSAAGLNAWATGGFLRDYLLGRPVDDIDITIDGDPLAVGTDLAAKLNARFVVLDSERRHARLVPRRSPDHIDLMALRASSIEDDLRLRDYTIDALAAPLPVGAEIDLLDPTAGLRDLHQHKVRAISEECLVADPLRLLRGVRIANQLGFDIDRRTKSLIRRNASRINEAASERQREELVRIFATDSSAAGIRILEELRLLSHVIPEIDVTRGVEQPKEHYYDVFHHGLAALEFMDVLLATSHEGLPRHSAIPDPADYRLGLREGLAGWDIDSYLQATHSSATDRRTIIKLCALLHDIGKPATKSFEANGRMRFFGHSDEGAKLAGRIMRRLRFPARQVRHVRSMILAHLRPIQLAQGGPPSRRAVYKFFRDTGDAGIDTLLLSLGDHLATTGPRGDLRDFHRHVALIAHILRVRFQQEERLTPPRLVTGRDIITQLGVEPGAQLGRLLAAVREAHATGEIESREQALALARALLERERAAVAQ